MFLVAFVCVHIILSVSKQDSLIKLRRGVKWVMLKHWLNYCLKSTMVFKVNISKYIRREQRKLNKYI